MLHTKYISWGTHGFREKDFLRVFPIIKSMETVDPRGGASLDPTGLIGRFMYGTSK